LYDSPFIQSNTTTPNVETSDEILDGIQNSMEGTKQEKLLILTLEGDNKLKSIIECIVIVVITETLIGPEGVKSLILSV
jgi:hypothetical protein